jgi:hypothetical protein
MIIFKVKCTYLLHTYSYVTTCLVANLSNFLGVTSHLYKFTESQYLSSLAHDL